MQQKLETTLAKLVFIPSLTEDVEACREALNFLHSELEDLDLFIHNQIDSPHPWLAITTQDTLTPDILLVAHLDVVPAPTDMFVIKKHAGKLMGRGVYDMKFAAACYVELFKAHVEELQSHNIGLLFTTDEEKTSKSMMNALATGLRPKIALVPDGGDNWTIEKRSKGFYGIEVIAHGKTAHGSRPWEGENALHTLLDVIHILREKYPFTSKDEATFMVNSIKSGDAFNKIPDRATALIDFRCFDKKELLECQDFIAKLVKEYGLELHIHHSGGTTEFDETAAPVQQFLQAFHKTLGTDTVIFCDSYGGTDARFLRSLDIPCVVMEPHGGGRHSNDEWILASDLLKYYHLLEQWIFQSKTHAS